MPTLDWIGKKAVVNHHREVPYRLIHCEATKSHGDPEAGNLLVQGDNLEALKALLPHYAGKVKCIYIDPPYNTGNEGWIYNDNVNSPEIKAWLGSVVGKEAEDLSRHDKWLCMMYPRLRLLRDFLSEDGFLFISIDDNEVHSLRFILDDIFGRFGFVANFVWKSRVSEDTRATNGASNDHEYIVCFSGVDLPRLKGVEKDLSKFANPDCDSRGVWRSADMTGLADKIRRPNLHFDLINPETGINYGCPPKGWRFEQKTMKKKIAEGRILWPSSPDGRPRHKLFLHEMKSQFKNISSVITDCATTDGTKEINRLLWNGAFDFPKPSSLIKTILEQAVDEDSYVLDSFAGSGTTAHAVGRINEEFGSHLKYILIEINAETARNVTTRRLMELHNASHGMLNSGFRFCTLGEPLFDADGNVNPSVTFPDLAAHVFFCETGSPIPRRVDGASSLIGTFQGRAIHLLHSAESPGVAREDMGNVLTTAVLAALPKPSDDFAGTLVVYAEGCSVPEERLAARGVVFKQIPYQIEGL